MTDRKVRDFLGELEAYYAKHARHELPWRQPEADDSFDPYKILVSEIMLQQTQVARVIPKYSQFLATFPTVQALAGAEQGEVVRTWSGLGYNRRARYLHQAATQITELGEFPNTDTKLVKLSGVGKNSTGAILAYAFNQPALFIETNIRTVYIHHFFSDKTNISDAQIMPLLEQTLDTANPRQFYWALMDYGTFLKSKIGNLNKLSKQYNKQSAFAGSARQVRGQVLRLLGQNALTLRELQAQITDSRLTNILEVLVGEGMVQKQGKTYSL